MLEILELSDLKEKPSNYAPFTPPTVAMEDSGMGFQFDEIQANANIKAKIRIES